MAPQQGSTDTGMMRVAQVNQEQRFRILAANTGMASLMGCSVERLLTQDLDDLFPREVRQTLREEVDFSDGGPDVREIITKIPRLTLVRSDGDELPVMLKMHSSGVDGTAQLYDVIIRPSAAGEARSSQHRLASHMAFHTVSSTDAWTNLPDRTNFTTDLTTVISLMNRDKQAKACLAAVNITNLQEVQDKHGNDAAMRLMRTAGQTCINSLRGQDRVALVTKSGLGLLLLDTDKVQAPVPINRMRMSLAAAAILADGEYMVAPAPAYALTELSVSDAPAALMKQLDEQLNARLLKADGHEISELRIAS